MNCRQVRLALSDYIDGELSYGQRCAVEAHLHGCPGCREECETQRRMARLLAEMPRRQLTATFDAALQSRLRVIDAERAQRPGWFDLVERFRPRGLRNWRPLLAPLGIAALALALLSPTAPPPSRIVPMAAPTTYTFRVAAEHLRSNDPRDWSEREAEDEALRANSVGSLFQ